MPDSSEGGGPEALRERIIGLGERSFRKSYYPELQRRISELERLRMLLDRSLDMVFVLEVPSGRILDVNDPALRQLGFTREGLLAKSLFELVEPDESPALAGALSSQPSTPARTVKLAARLRRESASPVPVELHLTIASITGSDYALAIARDVTERLRIEEELRRGKAEAEAASRAKAEFLDIASHELRTPLTTLRLLVDKQLRQLGSGREQEQARRIFERMKRPLDRLVRLVEELLNVSRLERGTVLLQCSSFDLAALTAEMVESFRAQTPGRALELSVPAEPVLVEADATRISQVVGNLLDNALKYSSAPGAVRVAVTAPGQEAVVSVSDRGPGISPDHQGRLFTRFFRTPTEVTVRQSGLGLGLYISREIVRAHGGRIWVESVLGEGSTFSFALPRAFSPLCPTE